MIKINLCSRRGLKLKKNLGVLRLNIERGGGSQNEKPTCFTCRKSHYVKCLAGTSGLFGCGKDDHKVRDCPTIDPRGREGKKVAPNVPKDDAQNKRHFYALQTRGEKPDEDDDGELLCFFSGMSSL